MTQKPNPMIERVALALIDEYTASPRNADAWKANLGATIFPAAARAAIEAMREPTDEMVSQGSLTHHDPIYSDTIKCWKAMIIEALK